MRPSHVSVSQLNEVGHASEFCIAPVEPETLDSADLSEKPAKEHAASAIWNDSAEEVGE